MGFKEVASLDCDVSIQLGGTDRKTGKAHPTSIEGYYLGSNNVPSPKAKSGFSKLHIFQTNKGNVGVWGKTNLDRKLASAGVGTMTRVTYTGMQETKNNPMYVYKVEADSDNTIDVGGLVAASSESDVGEDYSASYGSDEFEGESDVGEETAALDEAPPSRPSAPRKAATTPNAAQQARVQAMLNGRVKTISRS